MLRSHRLSWLNCRSKSRHPASEEAVVSPFFHYSSVFVCFPTFTRHLLFFHEVNEIIWDVLPVESSGSPSRSSPVDNFLFGGLVDPSGRRLVLVTSLQIYCPSTRPVVVQVSLRKAESATPKELNLFFFRCDLARHPIDCAPITPPSDAQPRAPDCCFSATHSRHSPTPLGRMIHFLRVPQNV